MRILLNKREPPRRSAPRCAMTMGIELLCNEKEGEMDYQFLIEINHRFQEKPSAPEKSAHRK
jgi:hypothetical protein